MLKHIMLFRNFSVANQFRSPVNRTQRAYRTTPKHRIWPGHETLPGVSRSICFLPHRAQGV